MSSKRARQQRAHDDAPAVEWRVVLCNGGRLRITCIDHAGDGIERVPSGAMDFIAFSDVMNMAERAFISGLYQEAMQEQAEASGIIVPSKDIIVPGRQ